MSLHVAAQHLASKGRDGDTELVHMTKGEIKGLQGLALAHGGSLSINPNTGLVEAGFLRNMLPMIAGAALVATGVGAPLAAGLVGGFETLRTGDITKGLTAGLSAYGGAGLGAGLTAAGGAQAGLASGAEALGTTPELLGTTEGMTNALSSPSTYVGEDAMYSSMIDPTKQQTFVDAYTKGAATPETLGGKFTQMGQGFGQLGTEGGRAAVYNAMPTGTLPSLGATVASSMMPEAPKIPGEEEEDPRYKGSPYRYNLASNFAGSTPATPNPYYNPTGLGYGAQGGSTDDIMMAAGGSYDDEPMGDDFAMGGSIGGYSDGGRMLKGPGDGMSDSIPATIGKRQPARLADGEFVVPADVVSHLGNGSTDAGAKHLYSMMDKVRKARTGTKKQGKQIKSEKYMPA